MTMNIAPVVIVAFFCLFHTTAAFGSSSVPLSLSNMERLSIFHSRHSNLEARKKSNNSNRHDSPLFSTMDSKDDSFATKPPAAAFGSPISDEAINFNKSAIKFVKDVIFDRILYQNQAQNVDHDMTVSSAGTYARFYALETIARMPYFAYLSVLHLYETLGQVRKANYLRLHFTESWNEMHHLLIMEELGGNSRWADRFVAQHAAFFYYWFVVAVYLVNPVLAYNLNEAVEDHAFNTYDDFLTKYEVELKAMPAPKVAKDYYHGNTSFLEEMQTHNYRCTEQGRVQLTTPIRDVAKPIPCDTLYDVFVNIRNDEAEHANTMRFLQMQDSDIDITREEGEECILEQ